MKINVLQDIRADFPFCNSGVVRAGIHEVDMNPHGAVSCVSNTGVLIGVKLDEFEFLTIEDRDEWLKIAHPNIPKVTQNGI